MDTPIAYTIVGIRLNHSCLMEKRRVKACKHKFPKNAKFCPRCGRETFKDEYFPRKEYDEEEDKFVGFDVVQSNDSNCIYIGKVVATCSSPDGMLALNCSDIDPLVDTIKQQLFRILFPLKLWDERYFGLWTALLLK